jgi:thymidylate synthase (FAD)
MPLCFRAEEKDDAELAHKKAESRRIFTQAFSQQEELYKEFALLWGLDDVDDEGKGKSFHDKKFYTSAGRRIVGMGVATGGLWTGNLRAIRHVVAMRHAPEAEEEISHIFGRILGMMMEKEPLLMGDFKKDKDGFYRPKYWKV